VPEHEVRARDGCTLRVREAGDLHGDPVFVHHGTPASGLLFDPWVDDARARGLRLVSQDRPGYGGSDRQPGRTIADVAGDVNDIADHLGIERYATWGVSGGGPHALACAALAGGRCIAAAALASVAPHDGEGLDFTAGMGESNVHEFSLAQDGRRDALVEFIEQNAQLLLAAAPEEIFDGLSSLLSDVDKAVITDEFARFLYDSIHHGIDASIDGWLDDDMVFVTGWGFNLADIDIPVLVYQGRQDRMVPYAHGEWLAERIPIAEARLSEEGHLTLLLDRVSDTHAWLKETF
jgi:pimeloyl-ACP methyl ester carboxylesterase